MTFTYRGYGKNVLTFRKGENPTIGSPVKMVYNNQITDAGDGEEIFGICTSIRNNYCGVQIEGYVELPYTGTKPNYHHSKIVSNGEGGVKVSTASSVAEHKIIKVDETNKICGFIL